MATLKFYLKEANKKNLHPVMFCYQDKGKKFRYYTRIYATKQNWQKNRIKAVSLKDLEDNDKLENCERAIKEIQKEAILKSCSFCIPEIKMMFTKYMDDLYKTEEPLNNVNLNQSSFFQHYDDFMEKSKATKEKSTVYQYKVCKLVLQKFEKKLQHPISFESINNSFYEQFHNYMIKDLNFLNNTLGGHIKNLKVFLNHAMRNELTPMKYNYKDFKSIKDDIDIIALSEDELFRLYECKGLSNAEEIAKDYLCFECFTGLRFSDIGRINKELMTIEEVAEHLSITTATVHAHANKGKLIRHKVGSHTLFKREDVDKLVNLSKK